MSMINLRRYIESESEQRLGVEGIFTCRALKDGKIVRERTFHNLITNTGMDSLQTNPSFLRMHLGTGTTTPSFTDTGLATFGVNVLESDPTSTRYRSPNEVLALGPLRRRWPSPLLWFLPDPERMRGAQRGGSLA